jgi:CHAT domain-containing protein
MTRLLFSSGRLSRAALLAVGAAALAPVIGFAAAPRGDIVSLGQSATTGAVCEARRDYEDPAAQLRGAKAWEVRCRGWDVALGRLYAYERDGEAAVAASGPWRTALQSRADCDGSAAAGVGGLSSVQRLACKSKPGGTDYVAYTAADGRTVLAADGFAQVADVLETGLRVVSGVIPPPVAVAAATAAPGFSGSGLSGLAEAAEAAGRSPERLRTRGYTRSTEWRFSDAETDFRALALQTEGQTSPVRDRAEALYNLALNVSNNGRFEEANALFGEADALARTANDRGLDALAFNYRGLHARNQRQFADAIAQAEQGLALRAQLRRTGLGASGVTAGQELATGQPGELVIGADLAAALNRRGSLRTLGRGLSNADRLTIQDAQALHIIGSSAASMGQNDRAAQALQQAHDRLAEPGLSNAALWLRARVDADLAIQDVRAGRLPQAEQRLNEALVTLRRTQAGTPSEAALLFELGRVKARADRDAEALADYDRAFGLFRDQRGSLGASADAAGVYFDLLLERIAAEPGQARTYAEKFFSAAQAVLPEETAQTRARITARLAQSDSTASGLARALDDTRRLIRVQDSTISRLQSEQADAALVRPELERLQALQEQSRVLEQQLLAANPGYGQLVRSVATLDEMQAKLKPGELYVKVLLLSNRGYGLAVSNTAVRPYAVELSRTDAKAEVEKLRAPFVDPTRVRRFDVARSHELYKKVLGPIEGELAAAQTLIYEPDGALISFPVAAFVTDPASVQAIQSQIAELRARGGGLLNYQQVSWLGAKVDNSLSVSAASFIQSRGVAPSAARRTFLGFGDPSVGGDRAFASIVQRSRSRGVSDANFCQETRQRLLQLSALPETADEVRAVGRSLGAAENEIVLGGAFTDDGLKRREDLDAYRVLYFATHGLLPESTGCLPEPALVTSVGGEGSDALLDATEIVDLKLDADLVVLAACDTGGVGAAESRTGLAGTGDALGGLALAFSYAGARGLIVSHWQVDSASAVQFMTDLFSTGAPTQADGMRKAALAMMRNPELSHPFYWAAFTVVGDGGRAMPATIAAAPAAAPAAPPA